MVSFEKDVDKFIDKVKSFNSKGLNRNIFNPWAQYDDSDISAKAPEIRCDNLRQYLIEHKEAKYVLIAESPSTGARYTGIPMTSERVIKQYSLPYKFTSLKHKSYKRGERTACFVWKEIGKKHSDFVFWNAFAFNFNESGRWFRNPKEDEVNANLDILKMFINDLFPNAKVIALGDIAQSAISKFKEVKRIKHPSNDFNKEFQEGIRKYLK